MKYNESNIIGDAGEHLTAAKIIKHLGYPCRLTNIDIGIDAEIELVDINHKSTGQFIKCQIKTTTSDFFYLYIDGEHITYWNKINIPVVIFLVHLDTENIYWHCIEDINNYELLKSGYKISFDKKDLLAAKNKTQFDEIAFFPLKQQIKKIFNDSYSVIVKDNTEFLNSDNYDIIAFEDFVYNSNKIKHEFKKVDKLIRKYEALESVKIEYSSKLKVIYEYLDRIDQEKEQILIDHGDDYFKHLESENFNWD